MLIKLLPSDENPTVLYPVTFHDLPNTVTGPSAWTSQLNALNADDLETPTCTHALDKAAFLPSIVTEVTLDLEDNTVTCRFVDQTVLSWELKGQQFISKLLAVIEDVKLASRDREREITREEDAKRKAEIEALKEKGSRLSLPPTLIPATPPPSPSKASKHRKQRSLFTSLVSFLLPSSTPSSSGPNRHELPVYNSPGSSRPASPEPIEEPLVSSHTRRRRARSALVDICRLYVLSGLKNRITTESYYLWIAESIMRRANDRITELVNLHTEGGNPELVRQLEHQAKVLQARDGRRSTSRNRSERCLSPGPLSPRSPTMSVGGWYGLTSPTSPTLNGEVFFSDTDIIRDDVTESDGSSVHTPTSLRYHSLSSATSYFPSPTDEMNDEDPFRTPALTPTSPRFPYPLSRHGHRQHHKKHSSLSTTPACIFSADTLHNYNTMTGLVIRMQGLINAERARLGHVARDVADHANIMEIRGLRRAWLNRALLRDAMKGTLLPPRVASGRGSECDMIYGCGYDGYGGFGEAFTRSPLGRSSFTAEDLLTSDVFNSSPSSSPSSPSADSSYASAMSVQKHLFPVLEESDESTSESEDDSATGSSDGEMLTSARYDEELLRDLARQDDDAAIFADDDDEDDTPDAESTIRLVSRRSPAPGDVPISPTGYFAQEELEEFGQGSYRQSEETGEGEIDLEAGLPIRFELRPAPPALSISTSSPSPASSTGTSPPRQRTQSLNVLSPKPVLPIPIPITYPSHPQSASEISEKRSSPSRPVFTPTPFTAPRSKEAEPVLPIPIPFTIPPPPSASAPPCPSSSSTLKMSAPHSAPNRTVKFSVPASPRSVPLLSTPSPPRPTLRRSCGADSGLYHSYSHYSGYDDEPPRYEDLDFATTNRGTDDLHLDFEGAGDVVYGASAGAVGPGRRRGIGSEVCIEMGAV